MDAKLRFWNNDGFKSYVYWNDGNAYKNVLYLEVELARPTTDVTSEESEDEQGDRQIIFKRQRLLQSFDIIIMNPLVDIYSIIGMHDNVELTILATGETYSLTNVEFADNGQRSNKLASVTLTYEQSVVTTGCEQSEYSIIPC